MIHETPYKFHNLLTLLRVLIVDDGLNFATLAITCPLEHVESFVEHQVAILVHIPDGPVRQLAVVDDRVDGMGPEAVGERTTRELGGPDAFQFAFAH